MNLLITRTLTIKTKVLNKWKHIYIFYFDVELIVTFLKDLKGRNAVDCGCILDNKVVVFLKKKKKKKIAWVKLKL